LMMALEEVFRITLDETQVGGEQRLGDLQRLLESDGSSAAGRETGRGPEPGRSRGGEGLARRADGLIVFPSWNRWRLVWWVRRLSLPTWILPLARIFMQLRVDGLEHLADLKGPVLFASNHQSHMDTPAIMLALPARHRYSLATAMAKEFFTAHFNRREYGWRAWFTNSLNYYSSCAFFNTFPLPQREAGARQTLRYIGEIAGDGYSILLFPEGKRTETGAIDRFRPGVGMIGARLDLPVVPVRLEGLTEVLNPHARWPTRGPVRVAFGAARRLTGEDYEGLAKQVEEAVKALGEGVKG
jgi:1-acyl-sn-glycerol-3-phosphate acyltransferase